jgi:hypothetical protein
MAGNGSNTLRAVLKELGWSRTRLVAELRRQAGTTGESLPGTESVIALVSRWVNNHQQPSDFYRDLLARTLGRARAELFSDEAAQLELAAEAEPWLLARALEASAVGQAALEALEEAVGEFARTYPSTAPTILARPVLEHLRDVTRLLDGPLPVARRQRLVVVAGHLAGLAGSLAFDLRDEGKARAYVRVAVQAADDAGSPDLAAWALGTHSLIPTYTGDPAAALRLLQEAQDRAHGHASKSRAAWLAALASLVAISVVLVVTGPEEALRRHIFVPQHFWQYVALHFGFGPPGTRITLGQFLWDLLVTQVWLAVPVGLLAASLSVWNAERAAGGAEWSPFVRRRQRIDQRRRDRRTARLVARPRDHKLTTPPWGSPWTATSQLGAKATMWSRRPSCGARPWPWSAPPGPARPSPCSASPTSRRERVARSALPTARAPTPPSCPR